MFKKINPLMPLSPHFGNGSLVVATKAGIKNCSPEKALDYATLLLGCYRKVDCDDPEVFVTAAMAVLSHYPEDVVRAVVDPYSGIPYKCKWFPTIPEIREVCDDVNNAAKHRAEQDARVKEQFAERDRLAALDPAEKRREFIKREMAKINASLATTDKDKPAPPIDIREMDEGAEKSALARKLDADIAAQSARNKSTPLRLSPLALATFGIADAETAEGTA